VAIHAEIEELIEQQQKQQQDVVITTEALTKSETQNIVIAKEIFPIQNLDVHGDPGTESGM
jgi:ribosomal protein S3AE